MSNAIAIFIGVSLISGSVYALLIFPWLEDRRASREIKKMQDELDKRCDEAGVPRMKVTRH